MQILSWGLAGQFAFRTDIAERPPIECASRLPGIDDIGCKAPILPQADCRLFEAALRLTLQCEFGASVELAADGQTSRQLPSASQGNSRCSLSSSQIKKPLSPKLGGTK